ncbi:STAS domain-containing protein [candidate division KSB1 bacterium]|nr:STAS domain-containing protein [candidate division KSB1 bacterium]
MKINNIFILNCNHLISATDQLYLKDSGNVLHQVNSSFDLKRLVLHTRPDFIILELVSLVPDVLSLLDLVENLGDLKNVPRIAILNRGKREYVLLLARMGFQEILLKPVDIHKLIRLIDQLTTDVQDGDFRIVSKEDDDEVVIEFLSHLDVTNSLKLDNFIDHILLKQKKNRITFDLHRMEYIDSSGLGMLVICKKKLDAVDGQFKLINLNEQVTSVIQMLQLETVLEINEQNNVPLKEVLALE